MEPAMPPPKAWRKVPEGSNCHRLPYLHGYGVRAAVVPYEVSVHAPLHPILLLLVGGSVRDAVTCLGGELRDRRVAERAVAGRGENSAYAATHFCLEMEHLDALSQDDEQHRSTSVFMRSAAVRGNALAALN